MEILFAKEFDNVTTSEYLAIYPSFSHYICDPLGEVMKMGGASKTQYPARWITTAKKSVGMLGYIAGNAKAYDCSNNVPTKNI